MTALSYDQLRGAADLLSEESRECLTHATKTDLPLDDRVRWLTQGTAYELAAKRLREVMLTA